MHVPRRAGPGGFGGARLSPVALVQVWSATSHPQNPTAATRSELPAALGPPVAVLRAARFGEVDSRWCPDRRRGRDEGAAAFVCRIRYIDRGLAAAVPVVGSQQAVTPAGLRRRPLWPPLSMTLHPPGSPAFARPGSVAHFRVPINSFVCVFLQIDSRPHSRPGHLATTFPAR